LETAGGDLEGTEQLLFAHPGITAEPIAEKEKWFRISIAADVPPGTYDVWAINRFGISSPRLFAVSTGLTDVAETEPNNQPEEAQKVKLNTAINGSSDGNNQDQFRFHAEQGQRITFTCQAGLLDSQPDAVMSITTADGKPIAANSDYFGRDPLIDFLAPATADYLVVVNDLSYRGGHPYRLLISTGPQIENMFPRAIRAGESAEFTIFGRNLGAEAKPSEASIESLPLDQLRVTLTADGAISDRGQYRFAGFQMVGYERSVCQKHRG
jgi:hypothetical protein